MGLRGLIWGLRGLTWGLRDPIWGLRGLIWGLRGGRTYVGQKPEKIVLCGIIGHLPLQGRCSKEYAVERIDHTERYEYAVVGKLLKQGQAHLYD